MKTLPLRTIQKVYDLIGERYDWFGMYDARAKEQALKNLQLHPGLFVLDIGIGTGKEHARIQSTVEPGGTAVGVDISRVMLKVTQRRCVSPLCQADTRDLPIAPNSFDRIYAAYVLDLLAQTDFLQVLGEFRRVLKPGGCLVIAALTEGVNRSSRALVSTWKAAYAISPVTCAGCRPLQLSQYLVEAGFSSIQREVIVQMAVPTEILVAGK